MKSNHLVYFILISVTILNLNMYFPIFADNNDNNSEPVLDGPEINDRGILSANYFQSIDNEHNSDNTGFKTIQIDTEGLYTIYGEGELPNPLFLIDIDIRRGERSGTTPSLSGSNNFTFEVSISIKYNHYYQDRYKTKYDVNFTYFDVLYIILQNDEKAIFNTLYSDQFENQILNNETDFYIEGSYSAPYAVGQVLKYVLLIGIAIAILYVLFNLSNLFGNDGKRRFGKKTNPFEEGIKTIIILATIPLWGSYYLLKWYFVDRKKPKVEQEILFDEDNTLGDESLEEAILLNAKAMDIVKTPKSINRIVIERPKNKDPTDLYEDLDECCKYAYRVYDKYCGVCGKVIQYKELPPKE